MLITNTTGSLLLLHITKTPIKYVAITLLLLGLGLMLKPLYYYGKALVAQQLLLSAWQQAKSQAATTSNREKHAIIVKPWQWADTYPIAKLTYLGSKSTLNNDVDLKDSWIILTGMTGRTMAFAPAWLEDSAIPNQVGNTVISAHNDSHFQALAEVAMGDYFVLEDNTGGTLTYQVTHLEVVPETDNSPYLISDETLLTLITCYPFGITENSKSKRLIVQALALK